MITGAVVRSVDQRTGCARSEFVAQQDDGSWVGVIALVKDDPVRCAPHGEPFLEAVVVTAPYEAGP